MRYSYDISTKDKEISYVRLVEKDLLTLGFGLNKNGTKYLRDLILTAFFLQEYDFFIDDTIECFFRINGITNISKENFSQRIYYAIQNANRGMLKDNFYSVLGVYFDYEFICIKNFITLFITKLEKLG